MEFLIPAVWILPQKSHVATELPCPRGHYETCKSNVQGNHPTSCNISASPSHAARTSVASLPHDDVRNGDVPDKVEFTPPPWKGMHDAVGSVKNVRDIGLASDLCRPERPSPSL